MDSKFEKFLEKAIEEERQASDEYYDVALTVEDRKIQRVLQSIASDEHKHKVALERILKYIKMQ